jgi:anti-sigma B factor antagonist
MVPMSAEDPTHFAISCRRVDRSTTVVALSGSLDLDSAPELKRTLLDLLAEGRGRLVLDFSQVSFIDSTALGVLIGLKRNLAWPEMMAIAAPSAEVINLLEVTGIMRVFKPYRTVEAAVSSSPQASRPERPPGPT